MASRLKNDDSDSRPRRPAATTPDGREQQLIAMAYDAVEKKILKGEASSQELVHFLKLGSSRERREQARIEMDLELGKAKIEAMQSAHRMEELMTEAIDAFRSYSGGGEPEQTFDD